MYSIFDCKFSDFIFFVNRVLLVLLLFLLFLIILRTYKNYRNDPISINIPCLLIRLLSLVLPSVTKSLFSEFIDSYYTFIYVSFRKMHVIPLTTYLL
jgi:hypothetical protein